MTGTVGGRRLNLDVDSSLEQASAFFIATDYVHSQTTDKPRLIRDKFQRNFPNCSNFNP